MKLTPTPCYVPISVEGKPCFMVPLTKGRFAIIDKKSLELVKGRKWTAVESSNGSGYYAVNRAGRMHRFILGAKEGDTVDHENGDGLDNRLKNIRICTKSQNCVNRRTTPGRFLRGVFQVKKSSRYYASIKIEGKMKYLDSFKTEQEAHAVYLKKAHKVYGKKWIPKSLTHLKSLGL